MKKYFEPEIQLINTMEFGDVITASGFSAGGQGTVSYSSWSEGKEIVNDPLDIGI